MHEPLTPEPSVEELDAADEAEWYWLEGQAREAVKDRWNEVAPSGAPLPGDVAAKTALILAQGETTVEPESDEDGNVDGVSVVFQTDPLMVLDFDMALAMADWLRHPRHIENWNLDMVLAARICRPRQGRAPRLAVRRTRRQARAPARQDDPDPEPLAPTGAG